MIAKNTHWEKFLKLNLSDEQALPAITMKNKRRKNKFHCFGKKIMITGKTILYCYHDPYRYRDCRRAGRLAGKKKIMEAILRIEKEFKIEEKSKILPGEKTVYEQ